MCRYACSGASAKLLRFNRQPPKRDQKKAPATISGCGGRFRIASPQLGGPHPMVMSRRAPRRRPSPSAERRTRPLLTMRRTTEPDETKLATPTSDRPPSELSAAGASKGVSEPTAGTKANVTIRIITPVGASRQTEHETKAKKNRSKPTSPKPQSPHPPSSTPQPNLASTCPNLTWCDRTRPYCECANPLPSSR